MFNPDQVAPIKPNPKPHFDTLGKTRPHGSPKSDKDFRKMIQDSDSDRQGTEEEVSLVEERDDHTTPPSLFDLSAKKKVTKTPTPIIKKDQDLAALTEELNFGKEASPEEALAGAQSLEIPNPYPPMEETADDVVSEPFYTEEGLAEASDVAKQLGQNQVLLAEVNRERIQQMKSQQSEGLPSDTDTATFSSKGKSKKVESNAQTRDDFLQEKSDLTYINPVTQASLGEIKTSVEEKIPMARSAILKEIVDRIVEGIQTIQHEGKTDTIVTLRHPPLFAGSNITLTAFDTARNEFNIAFTNLSTPAKQFLDRRLAGDALTQALEQKGFVVHIVTTSTLTEVPIRTDSENLARQQGRDQEGQQGRQGSRQGSEEEA